MFCIWSNQPRTFQNIEGEKGKVSYETIPTNKQQQQQQKFVFYQEERAERN